MTDPPRLIDELPTSLAATLLRAGAAEPLPQVTLQRTLAGLGMGAAVISSGTAAAASSTVGGGAVATASLTMVAKWVGAGLIGGLLSAGTAATLFGDDVESTVSKSASPLSAQSGQKSPPLAQPPPPETLFPQQTHGAVANHGLADRIPSARAAVSRVVASPTTAASASPEDAAVQMAEVRLIDLAWTAFRSGDYSRTLIQLSIYESQARSANFQPEALFLRMESELALKRTELAKKHARNLLARFPRGPHARRAQAVLETP